MNNQYSSLGLQQGRNGKIFSDTHIKIAETSEYFPVISSFQEMLIVGLHLQEFIMQVKSPFLYVSRMVFKKCAKSSTTDIF